MKKLLLAASLTFLSTTAIAETACEQMSQLAKIIMYDRQNDMSLTDMSAKLDGIFVDAGPWRKLGQQIMIQAYSGGNYNTESIKTKVIADFADEWHVQCLVNG